MTRKTSEEVKILVERMIRRIRIHKTLEGFTDEQLMTVLDEAILILSPIPALVQITPPVIIFGDVHGQINDMLRFWTKIGEPPKQQWLYLGDYIDRCKKGLEVIVLLLCYKIKFPNHVHMLRGNHECQKTNRLYGFYAEMKIKRSVQMWLKFNKLFNELPLCASIDGRIVCMHGGISQNIKGWETLKELKKPKSIRECDEGVQLDLMWADPTNDSCDFRFNSNRYTSVVFGDSAIKKFCTLLNISMVVRAHEAIQDGHLFFAANRLCTIFSAPNYCGNDGNSASVMIVSEECEVSFTTLKPRLDTTKVAPDVLNKLRSETNAKSPNVQPTQKAIDKEGGFMSSLLSLTKATLSKKDEKTK